MSESRIDVYCCDVRKMTVAKISYVMPNKVFGGIHLALLYSVDTWEH